MYMANGGTPLYGRALMRQIRYAESHYASKNKQARHVFPHILTALSEGIQGGIVDPKASRWSNPVSHDISVNLLYHLFLDKKFLPGHAVKRIAMPIEVYPGYFIDGPFGLFNDVRDLMVKPGKTKDIAGLFDEERIPMRTRLVVLLSHMADAMTLHSPETLAALPYGGLRPESNGACGMFANPTDWAEHVEVVAHFMRDILCPAADIFGMSYVYRRIRDLAAQHLYPDIHAEVSSELSKLEDSILRTNLLVEQILKKADDACVSENVLIRTYRRNQDTARKHDCGEEERKSRGSITDKIAQRRSKGEEITVRDVHDIVARMVRAESEEALYFAIGQFQESIVHTLEAQGIKVVVLPIGQNAPPENEWPAHVGAMIERTDYIKSPKEETKYQSFHADVIFRKTLPYVNSEIIFRTEEMHWQCDEGGAAHHIYKKGILKNGVLLSFKRMLEDLKRNSQLVMTR
jgi:hypothetical protein